MNPEITHQKTVYPLHEASVYKHGYYYSHVQITVVDNRTVEAVFAYTQRGKIQPDPSTTHLVTGDDIPHDLIDLNGEFKPFRLSIFAGQLARLFA